MCVGGSEKGKGLQGAASGLLPKIKPLKKKKKLEGSGRGRKEKKEMGEEGGDQTPPPHQ